MIRKGMLAFGYLALLAPAGWSQVVTQLEAMAPRPLETVPIPRGGLRDGRREAAQACANAPFDSDKRACLAAMSRSEYFDAAAVGYCGRLNFGSDLEACVAAVADKMYLPEESRICGSMNFGSDVTTCFQRSGLSSRRSNARAECSAAH